MIKEFKCYTLLCDNCGIDLCEDSEVSGWDSIDYLEDVKDESGWISEYGGDYCFACISYDDDDELVIDKSRKNKYKSE